MKFIRLLILTLLVPANAEETTYHPTHPDNDSQRSVKMVKVRLLLQQSVFDTNIGVKKLSEFIKAAQNNIENTIGDPLSDFELLLKVKLTSQSTPSLEIASQGEVREEILRKISDGLKTVPDIRSVKEDLLFEIHFKITKKT